MRKVILLGVLFLLLSVGIWGCASSVPETTVPPSIEQPAIKTEQQILQEHPDNLNQALEELDTIE